MSLFCLDVDHFSLSWICSSGQIILTQSPGSQSVVPGQTVSIRCKTSSYYLLAWYHQKTGEAPKLLIKLTSERVSTISRYSGSGAGNGVDFTLTISGVEAADAGVYYCQSYHYINSQDVFTQ
uniref:Ig-like domain-containing protein n=1 Tax=Sander lucioperca TaxID=283035 RepID=A0A8D0AJ66_SANLU